MLQYRLMKGEAVELKDASIRDSFRRHLTHIDDFTRNQEAKSASLASLGTWVYELKRRHPSLDASGAAMQLALSQVRTASDPAILGGGLWFEPFTLEPNKRWVGAYAVVDGPGRARPTWEYSNDDYAYTAHRWYTNAVSEGWDLGRPRSRDLYMTEPYMDSLGGRPTVFITFTHVMYDADRSKIIGVATADWTLDSLQAALDEFAITDHSFAFLVHEPSRKVLYPVERDELAQLSDKSWRDTVDLAGARTGKVVEKTGVWVDGREYDVLYTRTDAGFVFGYFVDTAEAYEFIDEVARKNLLLALGTLLLAVLAMYLMVSRLTSPIANLVRVVRGIHKGDLDREVPVETEDEIGELAGAFNEAYGRIRDYARELETSEAHFRALIEKGADIIAVVTPRGEVEYASPSVRALGYDPAELTGTMLAPVLHRDDVSRVLDLLGGLSENAATASVDLRIRCNDGSWRSLEAIATLTQRGIVINARDVTERKRAEDALRKSEARMRQANKLEAVGRLAGGVAHDFNNAMTAVLGTAELLLRTYRGDKALEAPLREIKAAGEHAAALTRQLLTFSRQHVTERRAADLNGVVTGVEQMLRRLIGEDIELRTDLSGELPPIQGDTRALEQILVNLAVNARDAMPEGGKITISTSFERIGAVQISVNGRIEPGEYCVLRVTDTGVGMDSHVLANMFDPFFSTKGVEGGTGLGLSTVYGIVDDSGGFILVDSEPGKGTEFEIYWAPCDAVVEHRPRTETSFPEGQGEVVLVVEDEELVRNVTCKTLIIGGFEVLAAENGEEALNIVRDSRRIDLVITDVVMPRMRGPQLIEAIDRLRPGMPVVFVSGYSAGEINLDDTDPGRRRHLEKPFTPNRLLETARELIDACRRRAGRSGDTVGAGDQQ